MNKYPVKRAKAPVVDVESDARELPAPTTERGGWFSFHYSYTEVSAAGRTARVKSKRARFEDGKLTTESFEGECDRSAYDRNVGEAQRFVAGQAALFWKALGSFLLPPGK